MEGVKEVHKLGTVDGVSVCEPAAREDTQLKELSDSPILQHLCTQRERGRQKGEIWKMVERREGEKMHSLG